MRGSYRAPLPGVSVESVGLWLLYLFGPGGYVWGAKFLPCHGRRRGRQRKSGNSTSVRRLPCAHFLCPSLSWQSVCRNELTTSNGGPLGSCIDEERSELRDVVRVAEFSESPSF